MPRLKSGNLSDAPAPPHFWLTFFFPPTRPLGFALNPLFLPPTRPQGVCGLLWSGYSRPMGVCGLALFFPPSGGFTLYWGWGKEMVKR